MNGSTAYLGSMVSRGSCEYGLAISSMTDWKPHLALPIDPRAIRNNSQFIMTRFLAHSGGLYSI